jgi:type III secretion system YscD/HrpQ family protein
MSAKLIAEEGSVEGIELLLEGEGPQWTVGRDPDESQVVIEDAKVSRLHIVISLEDDNYFIENRSQTNPASLNSKPLTKKEELFHGDKIKIGPNVFVFYTHENAPQDNDTPTPREQDTPYETIFEDFSEFEADTGLDLSESNRFLLKVLTGPNTGAEFPLEASHNYLIGTDSNTCDIIFHDLSISKKHARLYLDEEEQVSIEDLESRNGVLIDGQKIEEKTQLAPNNLVSLGTSTFTIIDQDSEHETIISVPSEIHTPTEDIEEAPEEEESEKNISSPEKEPETVASSSKLSTSSVVLIIAVALIFTMMNITLTLFQTEEMVAESTDYDTLIEETLEKYPSVYYNYQDKTGKLFLHGHVLKAMDKKQLFYELSSFMDVSGVDEHIIIDELVWKEVNEIFANKPQWKSISIHSPEPGQYVLTGYLKKSSDYEALADYINQHFPYPDKLNNQVVVEQLLFKQILAKLQEYDPNIHDIRFSLNNGELTISGYIKSKQENELNSILDRIKTLPGIRSIKNYLVPVAPEASMINISTQYAITGFSKQDNINLSVIINGKIVTRGDQLDGMVITSIKPHAVFLEKDGLKYKIDYKN